MAGDPLTGAFGDDRGASYQTKTTYVLSRLREMIIGGELAPGTRILPRDIAAAFRVSATPVREAILQLQSEGYIESSPHMGAQVASWGGENLREVFELRALLEARLTRRAAANLGHDDLARLRALNREFRAAEEDSDFTSARGLNHRFHQLIWERAGQPVTLDTVNRLWAKFPWQIMSAAPGRVRRSADEHEALLDALEAGDEELVERRVREHVMGGYEDAERAGLAGDDESS